MYKFGYSTPQTRGIARLFLSLCFVSSFVGALNSFATPIELINPESLISRTDIDISYTAKIGNFTGTQLDTFLNQGFQLNAVPVSIDTDLSDTFNLGIVSPNAASLPRISLGSGTGTIMLSTLFPAGVPDEFLVFLEFKFPSTTGPNPTQWISMPMHITRQDVNAGNISEVARIGGISGVPGQPASLSFFAPRTVKLPIRSREEGESFANGEFFFALQNLRTGEIQIPQAEIWDWYPSVSGRHQAKAVRLDFLDSKAPQEPSYEEYKVLKVMGEASPRNTHLPQAVLSFIQGGKKILLRAETNVTGEVYSGEFSLDEGAHATPTQGSQVVERMHPISLTPENPNSTTLPQAAVAQVFTSLNSGEEQLKISLNLINSIATVNSGMGHDHFYFRKLQLCVEGAKDVYPWNPHIDPWNRGFYNYGSKTDFGSYKCLNLVKETSSGHLMLAGQSYSFLDIHFPLTHRQKHRSESFSKESRHFVVLNDRQLPNNYWNTDHMYAAGIPELNTENGYPANQIHSLISSAYSPTFAGGNQSACLGHYGVCALHSQDSPWAFYGPDDGNATGGPGKDSSTPAVVLAHNGRGAQRLDKAINTIVLSGVAALGRNISDGLVKPDGSSVTLSYMFDEVNQFWKCDVAPTIFWTASNWHPRRGSYRAPQSMIDIQSAHESAAAPVSYYAQLWAMRHPHNNQHQQRAASPTTAADITVADAAIRWLTNAQANWSLVCRSREMNAFPNSETFQNYLVEAQNAPGTGSSMGRDMEQVATISRLLHHYPELPDYLRTHYVNLFGEIARLAPRADKLMMKQSTMSSKLRSTTPAQLIDGFVSQVATRVGIPNCNLIGGVINPNCQAELSPETEVYVPWEGALASIALSTLWNGVYGHPETSVQDDGLSLKQSLCENTATYYDPNMLYTEHTPGNYFIAWSSFREIKDNSGPSPVFHQANWNESLQWNYVYTPINQYTDQDAAFMALKCPNQRSNILGALAVAGAVASDPLNPKHARAVWATQKLTSNP